MPRDRRIPPEPVMGTFYSAEGIYEFGGKHYKPKWYANLTQMPHQQVKLIIEDGYDNGEHKKAQTVLVTGKSQWEAIAPHYGTSWCQMCMFHFYDATMGPGELPAWLKIIEPFKTKLVHEYAGGGKCALYCYPEDMQLYFENCDVPVGPPVVFPPVTPPVTPPTIPSIPGEINVNVHVYHHPAEG